MTTEPTYANLADDPAWPRGCAATLWECVHLPYGYIPTRSACRDANHAREAAEHSVGQPIEWEEGRRRDNGQRVWYSQKFPYKSGERWFAIWV